MSCCLGILVASRRVWWTWVGLGLWSTLFLLLEKPLKRVQVYRGIKWNWPPPRFCCDPNPAYVITRGPPLQQRSSFVSSASQKGSALCQSKWDEQIITLPWDDPEAPRARVTALTLSFYEPRVPYQYKGVAMPMQSQEVGLEVDT